MEDAISQAVNAGLDMSMIPLDAGSPENGFVPNLTKAVADGKVSEERIDESVARILALKFRLGLFEHPFVDAGRANAGVEDPADRPLARKAAQESLVLLRNDGTLPLSRRARRILVTGPASDSPTNQLGGWSIALAGRVQPARRHPDPRGDDDQGGRRAGGRTRHAGGLEAGRAGGRHDEPQARRHATRPPAAARPAQRPGQRHRAASAPTRSRRPSTPTRSSSRSARARTPRARATTARPPSRSRRRSWSTT